MTSHLGGDGSDPSPGRAIPHLAEISPDTQTAD
jgi:hypothetical protein